MNKLKNVNFHVSPVRLSVQNLHKKTTEKDLKELFTTFAKEISKEHGPPKIVQCKIIRNKVTEISNGYGFIEFSKHEHALHALRKIANNIELNGQLVLVEFAIDDMLKVNRLKKSMKL
jgi:nucleolar protein 4